LGLTYAFHPHLKLNLPLLNVLIVPYNWAYYAHAGTKMAHTKILTSTNNFDARDFCHSISSQTPQAVSSVLDGTISENESQFAGHEGPGLCAFANTFLA
jgi:hypothetical protein